ncbi:ATPase-like protein [Desulfosarcina variabilis str. Montpellier]
MDAGPESPTTEGFGLFSIQERLSAIGGKFDIDSAPGRGTRITLIVPTNNPD